MFTLKNSLFLALFVLGFLSPKAQEDYTGPAARDYGKNPAKTAAYIELGGNAGLYSLNIDRIYYYKEKLKMSARLGFAPHFNGSYMTSNTLFAPKMAPLGSSYKVAPKASNSL